VWGLADRWFGACKGVHSVEMGWRDLGQEETGKMEKMEDDGVGMAINNDIRFNQNLGNIITKYHP
jgi:hypothetical protein